MSYGDADCGGSPFGNRLTSAHGATTFVEPSVSFRRRGYVALPLGFAGVSGDRTFCAGGRVTGIRARRLSLRELPYFGVWSYV
ncbi:hypothetical protein [Paenibacillus sp. GCM10012306]|uniref:hypothetical protein n=1 Tax=Paenibacillus sp. GCM10012306 TaxID=3317342 RepID=UPI0036132017